jgi:hypothetical protein
MTSLQLCPAPTFYQAVLSQCPVLKFGPNEQLLFMQLLHQLRASQIEQNACLDLLSELESERKQGGQQKSVRHVLELQCLFQVQLHMKLQRFEERRKHYEDKLHKLEEMNVSYRSVFFYRSSIDDKYYKLVSSVLKPCSLVDKKSTV